MRRALLALMLVLAATAARAETIRVASTTSTENSGLFAWLLPQFKRATGIEVHVVAVGTGQAIRIAMRGDADVLLVHHRPSEEKFVRDGWGVKRHPVMYNDFVLVGPAADPAVVAGARDIHQALRRLAIVGRDGKALFASRGDDSGTHKREIALWRAVGRLPDPKADRWYRETGSGMGATLNYAAAADAYTLTDRGTWIAFRNPRGLKLLFEGGAGLRNPYGIILVNPKRHPHVKAKAGQRFIDWLTGPAGQQAIAAFRRGGQALFFPAAAQSKPPQN